MPNKQLEAILKGTAQAFAMERDRNRRTVDEAVARATTATDKLRYAEKDLDKATRDALNEVLNLRVKREQIVDDIVEEVIKRLADNKVRAIR